MNSMASILRARQDENPNIDFRSYSGVSGMYTQVRPIEGNEKSEVSKLIFRDIPCPIPCNEYIEEPHVTVIWSRLSVSRSMILGFGTHVCKMYRAKVTGATYWEGHDRSGYVVLTVESEDLRDLHDLLLKMGAVHSFHTYEPHMTLASNVGPLTRGIRRWIERINVQLKQKSLPISFASLKFSDLWD